MLGADGRRYVASHGTDEVLRFDAATGAFVDVFVTAAAGGLSGPTGLLFGHDGSLLVASRATNQVLRYDAATGAFVDVFVGDDAGTAGIDETGGLVHPEGLAIGLDGHVYVTSSGTDAVLRYDGETGVFKDAFVPSGAGGLDDPRGLVFAPLGGLLVASAATHEVLEYDALNGAPLGPFVSAGSGGLIEPHGLAINGARRLFVASVGTDEVLRYHGDSGAFQTVFAAAGVGGLDAPRGLSFEQPAQRKMLAPSPGDVGVVSTLTVYGAEPNAPLALFFGIQSGLVPISGCGDAYPLNVIGLFATIAFADGGGTLAQPVIVPAVASGLTVLLQVLEPVACRSSNVIRFTAGDTGSAAFASIDPYGSMESSSTYNVNTFTITNESTAGQDIDRVVVDLSTAVYPDMVYDPFGSAGDVVGKDLQIDGDPGVGFVAHSFAKPHDLGFDQIELQFTDFNPTETLTFSIDVDPTTIQGSASPGPSHSGSINGLELTGSTITVFFSDGSVKAAETFRIPGSIKGSKVSLTAESIATPSIETVGLGAASASVNGSAQTIRVSGQVGQSVRLVVMEAGLYVSGLPGGGFDVDPFEANKAIAVTEHAGVVGTDGWVDIPITLTRSEAEAGLNYIVAAHTASTGNTGPLSNVIVLELLP